MVDLRGYLEFCEVLNMHLQIKNYSKNLREVAERVENKVLELKSCLRSLNLKD